MAWLSGWSYRKEISITGQTGAGTNYQVDFDIGDSAGGDFHLEGHCTSFPQDIEVTDNDGETLLDFWIEDITADPIKMWVKVADDLGSNQTIYVYYGKGEAPTASDISDTMIFGDDFDDGTLDTTTRWILSNQGAGTKTNSESGGELGLENQNTNIGCAAIKSQLTFTDNIIIEFKRKANNGNYITIGLGAGNHVDLNGGTSDWWLSGLQSGYMFDVQNGFAYHIIREYPASGGSTEVADEDITTKSETSYTYQKVIISDEGSNNIRWYYNDVLFLQGTDATFLSNNKNLLVCQGEYSNGAGGLQNLDYIFVRKYNSPEPAFSSAGSEETPPTGVTIPVLMHHYNQMMRA